jgi:hypothetical protein
LNDVTQRAAEKDRRSTELGWYVSGNLCEALCSLGGSLCNVVFSRF